MSQFKENERKSDIVLERIATGLRINRAGDDAAGHIKKMHAQIRGLNQAVRNIQEAASMVNVADRSCSLYMILLFNDCEN